MTHNCSECKNADKTNKVCKVTIIEERDGSRHPMQLVDEQAQTFECGDYQKL